MGAGLGLQDGGFGAEASFAHFEPSNAGGKTAKTAKLTLHDVEAAVGAKGRVRDQEVPTARRGEGLLPHAPPRNLNTGNGRSNAAETSGTVYSVPSAASVTASSARFFDIRAKAGGDGKLEAILPSSRSAAPAQVLREGDIDGAIVSNRHALAVCPALGKLLSCRIQKARHGASMNSRDPPRGIPVSEPPGHISAVVGKRYEISPVRCHMQS